MSMRVMVGVSAAVLGVAVCVAGEDARPGGGGDGSATTRPAPRTVVGRIRDDAGATARMLGNEGCLLVRSVARWDQVLKSLVNAGWTPPAKNASAEIDFEREVVVVVFRYGDIADRFAVRGWSRKGRKAQLDLLMSYVIYKARAKPEFAFNFALVTVPRTPGTTVTLSTYHPLNGGANPTPETAHREWSRTFGPRTGDVVDGLEAVVLPRAKVIKPGEDIRLKFTVQFTRSGLLKSRRFGKAWDRAYVWDGKFSNGYRNHSFLVTAPDGKTQTLRPAVIMVWDKNAPHPVEVSAGKPYTLPGWGQGVTFKSLKALGLDTTKPGAYVITGVYSQRAGETRRRKPAVLLWAGRIATAPVAVEVKGGTP